MTHYDLRSPDAAQRYFDHSLFGQLYTMTAQMLGQLKDADDGSAARRGRPAPAVQQEPKLTLLERIDAWFWRQSQKDRDAYLARSTDVHDLERRMAALDRATASRYY
jgi:hypothetical protein